MLVNVYGIYHVHACEQVHCHWAHSVRNSTIENVCIIIIILGHGTVTPLHWDKVLWHHYAGTKYCDNIMLGQSTVTPLCWDKVQWQYYAGTKYCDNIMLGQSTVTPLCWDKVLWQYYAGTKYWDNIMLGQSTVTILCWDKVLWQYYVGTKYCDTTILGQSTVTPLCWDKVLTVLCWDNTKLRLFALLALRGFAPKVVVVVGGGRGSCWDWSTLMKCKLLLYGYY